LAWQAASCKDFSHKHYPDLIKRLYQKLEFAKYQRLDLCGDNADTPIIFKDYLDRFDPEKGVCQIDGRSPAIAKQDGIWVGALARDQIDCGRFIVNEKLDRLIISRKKLEKRQGLQGLGLTLFGCYVSFIKNEDSSGKFGKLVYEDNILRLWDFSLPKSETATLWNGYARRNINAFVPLFNDQSVNEKEQGKYAQCDEEEFGLGRVKSFSHLACEDKQFDGKQWRGKNALMALKGDIDNLGLMFRRGLEGSNFSKMAALSRQINAFFAIYLPWLCQSETENKLFRNTYTVFAGGDDFFLIGSWHSQMHLARYLHQAFQRYVAYNPQIHFSVGLSLYKAGVPITYLAEVAENALDKAKEYNLNKLEPAPKNNVDCFDIVVSWDDFIALEKREQMLDQLKQDYHLSTGYLYGLLNLVDMKESVQEHPEQSIWHAYFTYRTYRLLEQNKRFSDRQRRSQHIHLAKEISAEGIEKYGKKYKVALFPHLYKHRY
jgi:CRISPR-associated protein Csm1